MLVSLKLEDEGMCGSSLGLWGATILAEDCVSSLFLQPLACSLILCDGQLICWFLGKKPGVGHSASILSEIDF